MILTGKEDLRVVKTIEGIKQAFEELICEKEYENITVVELSKRAKINKKTFYTYYETLNALLSEMQLELSMGFLERVKDYTLPQDLDKVNREFFLFSAEQGLAYEKITCGGAYKTIRDEMADQVTDEAWGKSKEYQKLSFYQKRLLMEYINNTVLASYRLWVEDGKRLPIEEAIDLTNRIALSGVKGYFT